MLVLTITLSVQYTKLVTERQTYIILVQSPVRGYFECFQCECDPTKTANIGLFQMQETGDR